MAAQLKRTQAKNEALQNQIKKQKQMEARQSQFCNSTMASMGMQYVQNISKNKNEPKFITRVSESAYSF